MVSQARAEGCFDPKKSIGSGSVLRQRNVRFHTTDATVSKVEYIDIAKRHDPASDVREPTESGVMNRKFP